MLIIILSAILCTQLVSDCVNYEPPEVTRFKASRYGAPDSGEAPIPPDLAATRPTTVPATEP